MATTVASVGAVGSAAAVRHAIGICAAARQDAAFRRRNGAMRAGASVAALIAVANAGLRACGAFTTAGIKRTITAASHAVADPDAVFVVTTAVVDAQDVFALVILTATAIQSGLAFIYRKSKIEQ